MKTWQQISEEYWVYGKQVRGIVRNRKAEICYYFEKGWVWGTGKKGALEDGGVEKTLTSAIEAAEKAMGLLISRGNDGGE